MHLLRSEISKRIPIPRSGTKYMARASSHAHVGVTVVVAVRDMLKIARTNKEVKHLVHTRAIKINGREVRDLHESITLFGILEIGKRYVLTLLPTGKFILEETKSHTRRAKVVGKKLVSGGKVQINLHDGTNFISKESIAIGDSIELDLEGKIVKKETFATGKKVLIISGKNMGLMGTIEHVDENSVKIKTEKRTITLAKKQVMLQ